SSNTIYASSLLPRPPTPTLFPYTTLFRFLTPDEQAVQPDRTAELTAALGEYEQVLVSAVGPQAARLDMILKAVPPVAETLRARPDRKSTRLNSSHVSISYPVFCLKKKRKM